MTQATGSLLGFRYDSACEVGQYDCIASSRGIRPILHPWEFQATCETPLKSLQSFVAPIISFSEPLQAGSLIVDKVVFEPRDLNTMLAGYSIPPEYGRGLCLTAAGPQEIEELLSVVYREWIDFLFVPEPQLFAIYADHDEFSTFYAQNLTNLQRIADALSNGGFKVKPQYQQRF